MRLSYILSIALMTTDFAVGQEKTCKQAIGDLMKYQMGSVTKCTKDLGYKGKEKTEKMNCIMKCVMISSGAFNQEGKLQLDTAMNFLFENLPLEVIEKASSSSLKCFRFLSQLDTQEPTCKTYEPLIKCVAGMAMTLCAKS